MHCESTHLLITLVSKIKVLLAIDHHIRFFFFVPTVGCHVAARSDCGRLNPLVVAALAQALLDRQFFFQICLQSILDNGCFWSCSRPAFHDWFEQVIGPLQIETTKNDMNRNKQKFPK
mmetsp:Transcript_92493/g.188223  ORF Transcript_92493/g.188223 Transcript_92493/m.188223 type:complete len:118 (-) Transcript_92493:898-1251(-)